MRVLVTGGAGFIGSHTVDALLKKGHDVRILDNLAKPVHLKGKPDYVPDEVEFILGDVRDRAAMASALKGVDAVYHFAAYQDYLLDFSTYFHVNSVSTALIYEIIVEKKLPVQKVIVASSQAVMGEGRYLCPSCNPTILEDWSNGVMGNIKFHDSNTPLFYYPDIRGEEQLSRGMWEYRCAVCGSVLQWVPSDESVIHPQNQYAMSKYTQEMMAVHFGKRYNIPTVCLRYSIVQGPRQSFYNAYSGANRIFCLSLFFDRTPTVYEDGKQVRDYVNIEDVVLANLLVLESDEANYQVFNVGGGEAYTVLEFYGIVRKVFDKDIKVNVPGEYRYGDTRHICSDISKLMTLGWKPQHTPEKSVQDYRTYLEKQTDIEDILEYAEKQMKMMGVVRKVKGK